MNDNNHAEVGRALNHVLRPMLAAFVQKKLAQHFGVDNWWRLGVLNVLYDKQKKYLPPSGTYTELTNALDIQICLLLIDIHWREIFSVGLSRNYINYIKEIKTIRDLWAHEPESFDDVSTARALDTMALVSDSFDEETAQTLRAMSKQLFTTNEPAAVETKQEPLPIPSNLKPWRDVIEPHPDVAKGLYLQSEFAINLAEVVKNRGRVEYTDPEEFFARTYLTGGLKKLLVQVLKRLTDSSGEPIIQLKTSFGGGKSHSLLALYHLFGGIRPEQSSIVREILDAAGVSFLPKVQTVVIVGTWENPLRSTLWGELAMQLANATGKPELYEMMRENDEQKISPGVALLKELFSKAGACLILIDELVAYGRKLRQGQISDGGTVGNLLSFIQELTEAVKGSPKTALVVSIPESEIEIGGPVGQMVLNEISHIFGRVEFVWTPVAFEEGYEIVRRRLFKECTDSQARENVCLAFARMYLNNTNDFPYKSYQGNYRERLRSCYPIHPELFDYLHERWTELKTFQKTRGVLRLMAKVIYELWISNDNSLMIMPGNIPLHADSVRDELTDLLEGNWNAIVNAEIDGKHSKANEIDAKELRFGRLCAARKISRAIFMGTAPGRGKGTLRGVNKLEIHLSTIQPQEIDYIGTFNDSLAKLKSDLYYLYSQKSQESQDAQEFQFWFGVTPTLRKIVNDKREQISNDDIIYTIEQKLRTWRGQSVFKAVHICPKNSADVPDEQSARLVILSPKFLFDDRQKNNAAIDTAKDILDNRGTIPRKWKNMLLFMAADAEKFRVLEDTVRDLLAWTAVIDEARHLNLDTLQREDADNNLKLAKENFAMKLSQTYCNIFAPERSEDGNLKPPMHDDKIDCTKADNISAASEKFVDSSNLIPALGPKVLLGFMDKFLWRNENSISFKKLWDCFAEFYYLPRLIDEGVLIDTVRRGVKSETFALAEDFQDGKYIELLFGDVACNQVLPEYLLVKAEVAKEVIPPPQPPQPPPPPTPPPDTIGPYPQTPPPTKQKPLPKNFLMDVELDNIRYVKELKQYVDEIASQLMREPNSKTSIHVAINIFVPEGIPPETEQLVTGLCADLNVDSDHFHFEP